MSFIEFLQIWFQNDLAALGTILITIVGIIVFLHEVVQKVNNTILNLKHTPIYNLHLAIISNGKSNQIN